MQQPAATAPSPTSSSFAGLLAALAAPAASNRSQPWSDDDLADDYATLSYEQALRTHARFRSPTQQICRSQTPSIQSQAASAERFLSMPPQPL